MTSLSQRVVGRMAAILFVGGGVAAIVLPSPAGTDRVGTAVVSVLAVGVGIAAWFAPWDRWRWWATLVLAPLAFALFASAVLLGSYNRSTYAVYYVVVFVWLGVSHRKYTSLAFAPVAAIAYAAPLVIMGKATIGLTSVWEVIVLGVLVGEALSWMSTRLRRAEALDSKRVWETQTLLQAAERLARERDPARAPELVASLGQQLLRADGTAVLLLEDRDRLIGAAASHWPKPPDGLALGVSTLPSLVECLRSDDAMIVPARTEGFESAGGPAFGSLLLLPLRGSASTEGILLAGYSNTDLRLDPFADHVARTFATLAALTLERVQAVRSLLEESLRDELTGLGNRRAANRELVRLQAGDAVAIADLDHLKDLNDSLGHAAGDELLKTFAASLASALREGDVACRLGGDEFLLVLRGVGAHAEAIVQRIADSWHGTSPGASFSAGVAVSVDEEDGDDTLERADAALYMAKRRGRDRVELASGGQVRLETGAAPA